MIATSASVAPRTHAAYVRNIVVTLWPCCSETQSGLLPIIRFQLTEVWRAQYGRRNLKPNRVKLLRQRFAACSRFRIGAPLAPKNNWS
jgi:hypothetical protein